jgi:hypothetical protein
MSGCAANFAILNTTTVLARHDMSVVSALLPKFDIADVSTCSRHYRWGILGRCLAIPGVRNVEMVFLWTVQTSPASCLHFCFQAFDLAA